MTIAQDDPRFEQYGQANGVPSGLTRAVVGAESSFNERNVSHDDDGNPVAYGLMQMIPGTAHDMGVKNVFDADQNLNGGTKYLGKLIKNNGGDTDAALLEWHGGPGPKGAAFVKAVNKSWKGEDSASAGRRATKPTTLAAKAAESTKPNYYAALFPEEQGKPKAPDFVKPASGGLISSAQAEEAAPAPAAAPAKPNFYAALFPEEQNRQAPPEQPADFTIEGDAARALPADHFAALFPDVASVAAKTKSATGGFAQAEAQGAPKGSPEFGVKAGPGFKAPAQDPSAESGASLLAKGTAKGLAAGASQMVALPTMFMADLDAQDRRNITALDSGKSYNSMSPASGKFRPLVAEYATANTARKTAIKAEIDGRMQQGQMAYAPSRIAKAMVNAAANTWVTEPADEKRISFQIGKQAGQLAPLLLAGEVAPVVLGLQAASGTFGDALDHGASFEKATQAAGLNGGATALLFSLPAAKALDFLDKYSGGRIRAAFVEAFKHGSATAVQSLVSQVTENAIASKLISYDPKRGIMDNAGSAAGGGGLIGGIMGFLGGAIKGGQLRAGYDARQSAKAQAKAAKATPPTAEAKPAASAPAEEARPGEFSMAQVKDFHAVNAAREANGEDPLSVDEYRAQTAAPETPVQAPAPAAASSPAPPQAPETPHPDVPVEAPAAPSEEERIAKLKDAADKATTPAAKAAIQESADQLQEAQDTRQAAAELAKAADALPPEHKDDADALFAKSEQLTAKADALAGLPRKDDKQTLPKKAPVEPAAEPEAEAAPKQPTKVAETLPEKTVIREQKSEPNNQKADATAKPAEGVASAEDVRGNQKERDAVRQAEEGRGANSGSDVQQVREEEKPAVRGPKQQVAEPVAAKPAKAAKKAVKKPAKVAAPKKIPEHKLSLQDERLQQPGIADELLAMGKEAGWFQKGGLVQRSQEGQAKGGAGGGVIGRTKWIPHAPWFQDISKLEHNNDGSATRAAIEKAIEGKPMSAAEKRHVKDMLDHRDKQKELAAKHEQDDKAEEDEFFANPHPAEYLKAGLARNEENRADVELEARARDSDEAAVERAAIQTDNDEDYRKALHAIIENAKGTQGGKRGAEARPGSAGEAPDLELKTHSEAEVKARQDKADKAAQQEQAAEEKAKQKAEAEKTTKDFNLTGSDRDADVAASKGQTSLFGHDQVQSLADDLTKKWPGVDVKVVKSEDDVPKDGDDIRAEGQGKLQGRYIRNADGTSAIYLVSDNLPDARTVNEVLAHEAVGHMAPEETINSREYQAALKGALAMERAGHKGVAAIAKVVDKSQPGLDQQQRAKEILAQIVQRGIHKTSRSLQAAVAAVTRAVKSALRGLGFKGKWVDSLSEQEIFSMLRAAEKNLEQGKRNAGPRAAGVSLASRVAGAQAEKVKEDAPHLTSIMNAIIASERERIGLPPVSSAERTTNKQQIADAVQRIIANPSLPKQLVARMNEAPFVPDDIEQMVLLHEKAMLDTEINRHAATINSEGSTAEERAESRPLLAALEDERDQLHEAARKFGSAAAKSLQARQAWTAEDYSLANMRAGWRASLGGKIEQKEAEKEDKIVADFHKQIEDTQKAIDTSATADIEAAANKQADEAVQHFKDTAKRERATGDRPIDSGKERQGILEGLGGAVKEGDSLEHLGRYIQKLALGFVRDGITDREKLIDAVHAVLVRDLFPDITRRQTMDAISGYGDFSPLDKEAAKVRLREIKGESQQLSKLEDIQAGKAPLKTGKERRGMSDEERRLQKQVNEAMRKSGIKVTDPARQLKSALDARRTAMRHRLADMRFEMAAGKKAIRGKTPDFTDPTDLALKAEYDATMKDYREIFGKKGLTDEQRSVMAEKALERNIADLEANIKAGGLSPLRLKSNPIKSAKLDAMRARRDALRAERKLLQDIANPKKTKDEIAQQAYKTRITRSTADKQDRITRGDFEARPQKKLVLNLANQALKAENLRVKQDFERAKALNRYEKRSRPQKVQDTIVKWRRGFLLSGYHVLGKLAAAGVVRMASTTAEEGVASILRHVPGISAVANLSPRYGGGANVKAEAKAFASVLGSEEGLKDFIDSFKTGRSQLDVLYNQGREGYVNESEVMPPSFIDFFGHLHAALKSPVKRAEWTRSVEKRAAFYMRQKIDVSSPEMQVRIGMEAYKDAQRSVFLQDNFAARIMRRMFDPTMNQLVDKKTGYPTAFGKAWQTVGKVLVPIVKVPTNIVSEVLQYSLGSVTGSAKLAYALATGVEKLEPEQADQIMRLLIKGSVGAAGMALGYFNPEMFGGYYQSGQRDPDDVAFGGARIAGHDIGKLWLHNPLLETFQIGATIRRVMDSKVSKKDRSNKGVMAGIGAGVLGVSEEVPAIQEMFNISEAAHGGSAKQFAGELGASMVVPQTLQDIAKDTDTDAGDLLLPKGATVPRKPDGFFDYFKQAIPGLRKDVPVNPRAEKAVFGVTSEAKTELANRERGADPGERRMMERVAGIHERIKETNQKINYIKKHSPNVDTGNLEERIHNLNSRATAIYKDWHSTQ